MPDDDRQLDTDQPAEDEAQLSDVEVTLELAPEHNTPVPK